MDNSALFCFSKYLKQNCAKSLQRKTESETKITIINVNWIVYVKGYYALWQLGAFIRRSIRYPNIYFLLKLMDKLQEQLKWN